MLLLLLLLHIPYRHRFQRTSRYNSPEPSAQVSQGTWHCRGQVQPHTASNGPRGARTRRAPYWIAVAGGLEAVQSAALLP